jgi:hypothetical protein
MKAYRNHGVRICNTSILLHLPQSILGETIYLEEFGDDLKTVCPGNYANHLSTLGYEQLLNGQKDNARENILLSMRYHFSIKLLIFYILSYILSKQKLIYLCKIFNKL